jgi:WD40 repeat protein
MALAWSPDSKLVAAGDHAGGGVRVWDVETAKEQALLKTDTQLISSVTFSRDGKLLAAGNWAGVVRVWDLPSGKELAVLEGHPSPVWSAAFSPDGKLLAGGYGPEPPRSGLMEDSHFPTPEVRKTEGEVRLWEVSTGHQQSVFKGHTGRVRSVAFSADGKTLASGSEDQTVRLWEIRSSSPNN